MMKVVGVIGAGAAGLCAARHISASPCMTPVVWEKASGVGGTWIYTPDVGKDEHGLPIHSSVYENLKTSIPKELMAFPDFPFQDGEESFLHHKDVLKYLEDYTNHFNLRQYIKFGQYVEEVKPVNSDDGTTGWSVTVKDLEAKTTTTTLCDAIIVCNGHYSVPMTPTIKDIDKFRGRQMHSHEYRTPKPFSGLRVVVLGASMSGLDISLELSTTAKEVLLSHNHPVNIPSELPANLRQVRGIVAANEDGFVFGDGFQAEADVVLYCTGYEYTFPFLSEECGVSVEDNIVKPLYKHLIHTTFPSMAFIGIPFHIVAFLLFDFQVRFFIALQAGNVAPLTHQQMAAVTAGELKQLKLGGGKARHHQSLGVEGSTLYMRELATLGHFSPEGLQKMKLFKITFLRMLFSCLTFRRLRYSVEADGQVREWRNGREVNTTLELVWLIAVQLSRLMWRDFWSVFSFAVRTLRNRL